MIVLDATNKKLEMKAQQGGTVTLSVVVTYWSINSSNVWTPHSAEIGSQLGVINVNPAVLLAAPGAGETRVVENIWISFTAAMAAGQSLDINVTTGSVEHAVATIFQPGSGTTIAAKTVWLLDRSGKFTRQVPQLSGSTPTVTQNVH